MYRETEGERQRGRERERGNKNKAKQMREGGRERERGPQPQLLGWCEEVARARTTRSSLAAEALFSAFGFPPKHPRTPQP